MKCPECGEELEGPKTIVESVNPLRTEDEYYCPKCETTWRDKFVNVKILERMG